MSGLKVVDRKLAADAVAPAEDITEDVWKWAVRKAIIRVDLSWGARECWRLIADFPPGKCFVSHNWLALTLNKSKSAVQRYLRELRDGGYIKIQHRYDDSDWRSYGQKSNVYVVLDQPDLIAAATEIFQDYSAKHKIW